MTPLDDDRERPAVPPEDESGAMAQPPSENSDSSGGDDDLPEWEPLTPELVEDEALRGDFGLRVTVCLLATLLAFTEISTPDTLVHVKTGQYIASHGWLPPSMDVFSYTAQDRPWVNLSWLFDLILAGVYGVAGAIGLTAFKALLAGATFGLIVGISRPNVSTWWGSICAGLAALVCYPQFTARPEIVTLLGLAWTLWVLYRWRQKEFDKGIWLLVPTFLIWSNLDERMFLGLALVTLYAVGEAVGHFLDFPGLDSNRRRGQLWLVLGACYLAAMVNPFGWHSWMAADQLYSVTYPALREHYVAPTAAELAYYPVFSGVFWSQLTFHGIAAFLLFLAALVTFVLNRSRLDAGDIFVLVGFISLAFTTSHELAAAALVSAVLVAVNAQDWYRATFRQTYSVETSELLFSRGGRAATVIALFAVAFLAVFGRLERGGGKHVSVGLDKDLTSSIEGFSEALEDSYDNRPFNFVLSQGDVLIWIDQKVFVDSRVSLYHGQDESNLLKLHDDTRRALRARRPNVAATGDHDLWQNVFDRFQVTHVVPRLTGPSPDYFTYFDLLRSPVWRLTAQTATTAVFYRRIQGEPELDEYLVQHALDFGKEAFQSDFAFAPRPYWPQASSKYDEIFSIPDHTVPDSLQEAGHYMQILSEINAPLPLEIALTYLAARHAHQSLLDDPNRADAYRILGAAYDLLGSLEAMLVKSIDHNGRFQNRLRYYQSLHAYNESLVIEPDHANTHLKLSDIYFRAGRWDLSQRELSAYQSLRSTGELSTDVEHEAKIQEQLEVLVAECDDRVEQVLQAGGNESQAAQLAIEGGCILRAVEILESDPALGSNPMAQLLLATCLMEAGQSERAFDMTLQIEGMVGVVPLPDWRSSAAMASLANADYARAVKLWDDELKDREAQRLQRMLFTLPFSQPPGLSMWPVTQTLAATDFLHRFPDEAANLLFNRAMCQVEMGEYKDAAESMHALLEVAPESAFRPLAAYYLFELEGESIVPEPPSAWIPITADMFAPDSEGEVPQEASTPDEPVESATP